MQSTIYKTSHAYAPPREYARADLDYEHVEGAVTFEDGECQKTIEVRLNPTRTAHRSFVVFLKPDPQQLRLAGESYVARRRSMCTVTIVENEDVGKVCTRCFCAKAAWPCCAARRRVVGERVAVAVTEEAVVCSGGGGAAIDSNLRLAQLRALVQRIARRIQGSRVYRCKRSWSACLSGARAARRGAPPHGRRSSAAR